MKTNRSSIHGGPTSPTTTGSRSIEITVEPLAPMEAAQSMGRRIVFVRQLDALVSEKMDAGQTRRYLNELRRLNMENLAHLQAAGMNTIPSVIGKAEVNYLRTCYPVVRGNNSNQKKHIQHLGIFLNSIGNTVVRDMSLHWPEPVDPAKDWLEPEEMDLVWASIDGIPDLSMLFMLEGCMGLRRCEVRRLTLPDIGPEFIRVIGKGRSGGKPRKVRKHPEFDTVFQEYLEHRDGIVRRALMDNHFLTEPDGLMLCYHMGRLTVCQRTALDRMMGRMRKAAGIHFSHHWLRRAFGRGVWMSGVRLEVVADLMGHSNTAETIKYLRLNLNDQADAMESYYNLQLRVRSGNTKTSIPGELHQNV